MSVALGFEGVIEINTGTYGTPVWEEVDIIQDCAISESAAEADISMRRGKGFSSTIGTLIGYEISCKLVNERDNAHTALFMAALRERTTVDLRIMDGPYAVAAAPVSQGIRAHFAVLTRDEGQAIADANMLDIVLKVGYFPAGQEPKPVEGIVD